MLASFICMYVCVVRRLLLMRRRNLSQEFQWLSRRRSSSEIPSCNSGNTADQLWKKFCETIVCIHVNMCNCELNIDKVHTLYLFFAWLWTVALGIGMYRFAIEFLIFCFFLISTKKSRNYEISYDLLYCSKVRVQQRTIICVWRPNNLACC